VQYTATGTCTGTLDGKSVSNAPVSMSNHAQSDGSCLYARTVAPAEGSMSFAKHTVVSYTFEFTYAGTDGVITFTGKRSGSAVGHGTFLTPNSSPDAAAGCYNGKGVPKLTMDIQMVTQRPLVSAERMRSKKN